MKGILPSATSIPRLVPKTPSGRSTIWHPQPQHSNVPPRIDGTRHSFLGVTKVSGPGRFSSTTTKSTRPRRASTKTKTKTRTTDTATNGLPKASSSTTTIATSKPRIKPETNSDDETSILSPRVTSSVSLSTVTSKKASKKASTSTTPKASSSIPLIDDESFFSTSSFSVMDTTSPPRRESPRISERPPDSSALDAVRNTKTNNNTPTTSSAAPVLTPRSIREFFQNSLRLEGPLEHQLQQVQGLVQPSGSKRSYVGYYYEQLYDATDADCVLTLKIPQTMYTQVFLDGGPQKHKRSPSSSSLTAAREMVQVQGFVTRKAVTKNCSVQLIFEVTQAALFDSSMEPLSPQEEHRLRLLRRRAHQPPRMTGVEDVLKHKLLTRRHGLKQDDKDQHETTDQLPRLLFITGETSIVDQDVQQALGSDVATQYELTWKRVNLSQPGPLQELLAQEDLHVNEQGQPIHVIAIVRGGGDGLGVFDDPNLAETALDCRLPLVTALGHATDSTLLDDMADCNFTTPTKIGAWLKELALTTQREMNRSELLLKQKVEEQQAQERKRQQEAQQALVEQLEQLRKEQARLVQEKKGLNDEMQKVRETGQTERTKLQQQVSDQLEQHRQQQALLVQEKHNLQEEMRKAQETSQTERAQLQQQQSEQLKQYQKQQHRLNQEKQALQDEIRNAQEAGRVERGQLQQQVLQGNEQAKQERENLQQQLQQTLQEMRQVQEQQQEAIQWKQYYAWLSGGLVVLGAVLQFF